MNNLEYSTDAKNILNDFYEVDKILYVEGIDDKVFWGILFDRYSDKTVEIIDVGGVENLKPYIEQIERSEILNAYVACDQDYNFFKDKEWHNKVICTFGHSIENSLVSRETICDVVRGFSKSNKKSTIYNSIDKWYLEFIESITDLVYCDIHNEKHKLGLSLIGDSCSRFLLKKGDFKLSNEAIIQHISKFFTEQDVINLKSELNRSKIFNLYDFIRGHFLLSAALKFVTVLSSNLSGKSINIAKDAFFSNILIGFEKNLDNHPHNAYYEAKINQLS
ncbi:DUF4435 domain-containing protein [Acinetobacter baumannii]|uniref:DUF4435 domain-containing protein n=2 Tax=Acinetobacter baumannii TaxID=470 RepID=UPI00028EA330|nr:DUF4435 domain-containing protein [Acinetobacter baumannii]EJB8469166.1 DUF4435 domain-containing protein [Acinetobacter baumannii]EKK14368.1 hypothetical protein ACINNAV72_1922 [Acinetobacter baumannii Naval-72]EKU4534852.1 DUF4435 domain-containing protein [Acinetobacter baumannii]EKU4538818.1 DUF4435 domain-containing protein [Acinetobacter baumannii]EKW5258334.1 DUF4435 domain-containing protein [Acinetobacter baumannii]